MEIFLARQPIFDRQDRVWGYELQSSAERVNAGGWKPGEAAGLRAPFLSPGFPLDKLAPEKKVCLKASRDLIFDNHCSHLPKDRMLLAIPVNTPVDGELRRACQDLHEEGYLLALDGFAWPADRGHPLIDLAQILRIEVSPSSLPTGQSVLPPSGLEHLKLMANCLETREEFREARQRGCSYFQGLFFSSPEIVPRDEIPSYKFNYVRILNELSRAQIDFSRFQKLIEGNPPLVHRFLSYLNSAFFGLSCRVTSVGQALLLLGEQEIKKWAALAIIHHLGQDHPEELWRLSLLRARFGEILAGRAEMGGQDSEFYLVGLLSLLDVYLGRPLAEVLNGVPLSPLIRETLLGGNTPHRQVFDLVLANERADWDRVADLAERLGLREGGVLAAYLEAVGDVEQAMHAWLP